MSTAAILLAGCGSVGGSGDGTSDDAMAADGSDVQSDAEDLTPLQTDGSARPECLDNDHDGYGMNCPNGPDCNDNDPTITNECYRCARPATGCPCTTEGQNLPCDAITDSTLAAPDGVCHLGQRTCESGHWTRCAALDSSQRTIVPPMSCGSACDPNCNVETVCPSSSTDLSGSGMGVVIGSSPAPGFCPPGTPPGGITLPGGTGGAPGSTSCTGSSTCGGACCTASQTCYSYTDSNVTPPFCSSMGRTPPPPVTYYGCGPTCPSGSTHCGDPPNDQCCPPGSTCRFGTCRTTGNRCNANSDCPSGQFCDNGVHTCFVTSTNICNCEGDNQQQACLQSMVAQGGVVVNDIFHTADGHDARTLLFAHYMRGLENAPTTCVIGRSNYAASGTYSCSYCTPTDCTAWECFWGAPHDWATVHPFADNLDWLWVQHVRYDDTGAVVSDGNPNYYYPWHSAIYDLGAPANRVVLFPVTDHVNDSCLEPFEYTVWLSDNPNATTIAPQNQPDPNQWNQATLVRIFTQGWTRNPRAMGNPSDTSDLESTAFGDSVADAFTSVWALPCGYSFRYAAISAGNNGRSAGAACQFNSFDDEIDAVAGLNADGNSLGIYHVLPYGSSAGPDPVPITASVRSADVYFLMDTTGSMGGELANLQSGITSGTYIAGCSGGIIGGIRCLIPDAWFGVGHHDDFPMYPYGEPGWDQVYQNHLSMTPDTTATANAIQSLTIHSGSDAPESQLAALFSIATGQGYPGYLANQTSCPAGTFGYPCFRQGHLPIVMMFTDAMYHNGPGNSYPYSDSLLFGSGSITYPPAVPVSGNGFGTGSAYTLSETASFVGTGSTLGSWNNNSPPCAYSYASDVIYKVTLTATRSIHLDTCGSSFDTTLYVFNSSGALMGCNDDSCGLQSALDLTLSPGTYYIYVDGWAGNAGNYVFHYGIPSPSSGHAPTFTETVNALNAIGAKVIVISSCGTQSWCQPDAANHAVALANATGSTVSGGGPAVYYITDTGSGLGSAVIQGVTDLANSIRMNVTAVAQDNPATPSVDERCFVNNPPGSPAGTVPLSNPALGQPAPYASGQCVDPPGSIGGVPVQANQCLPGAQVNFEATWANNCVMSTSVTQTFNFTINVYGNGTVLLGQIPVTIVVPPAAYPPSGTFTYDVDSTTVCAPGEQPDWGQLQFVATTPTGTSIQIAARTATTSAGLSAAPNVTLGVVPPATSPIDVSAALLASGQSNNLPYLRITFTLYSDASHSVAPTLSGYRVLFDCVPGT